jgi:hypothetical protein
MTKAIQMSELSARLSPVFRNTHVAKCDLKFHEAVVDMVVDISSISHGYPRRACSLIPPIYSPGNAVIIGKPLPLSDRIDSFFPASFLATI